jgi:hypothetical protein
MSQHMDALAIANKVRLARAALKQEITEGTTTVVAVLSEQPTGDLASMPVYDLLKAQNRWGRMRVLRVLRAVKVGEGKPIGDLTERQRQIILAHVFDSRPVH